MFKSLRLSAVIAVVVLLVGAGCKKNSPPNPPDIQGPASARPAVALSYGFTSTDPDGDSVSYSVSWGDGTPASWSPGNPSGAEYFESHTYADSGKYFIKAMAKDMKNSESAWSDSVQITIGSFPPNTPVRPQGKAACTTGVAYTYTTKASHPLKDSVKLQFYWGGAAGDTSAWGALVASDQNYSTVHTFTTRGTYKVAARAMDAYGLRSAWSDSLVVTVDSPVHANPGEQPHSLVLSAASDSTVNIAWAAPTDSAPSRYVISFKQTRTTTFDSVGYTTTALSFVHNPSYKTGTYQVTAVFAGGLRNPSAETPTTTPAYNVTPIIPELSDTAYGNAGYGWDRAGSGAELHDMTNTDTAALVDFYVTDFKAGYAGPLYYTASPQLAPTDPGGIGIPASPYWHNTGFTLLDSGATEDDPLPRYASYRYRDSAALDTFPMFTAFYTYDSFFGLVKTNSIDLNAGTANIETWFQRVKNLRLIQH
ncbi:MAG TPA: PKD domain-containing protein [bacterium]|nr:PKD domain-containing protein [bacterium]